MDFLRTFYKYLKCIKSNILVMSNVTKFSFVYVENHGVQFHSCPREEKNE